MYGSLLGNLSVKDKDMERFLLTMSFVMLFLTGCNDDPYNGIVPEYGPSLHESGRPAIWHAYRTFIDCARYEVVVGPSEYQDDTDDNWDYYSIYVAARHGYIWNLINRGEFVRTSSAILKCDFRIDDLPEYIVEQNGENVVDYDPENKTIWFNLGSKSFSYSLPST